MKVLIAYASKTGTAAECAQRLQKELKGADVTITDLALETPCPHLYDVVIVGSSIRYGKMRREAVDFLRQKQDEIAAIPHGLFLCLGSGHAFDEICQTCFSDELRKTAFAVLNFGGRLKLKQAGLWERFLLHAMRSRIVENEMEIGEYTPTMPDIIPENISRMAAQARTAFGDR